MKHKDKMQTVVEEFEKKLGRCGKRGRNSAGSRFVAGDRSSDSQEGGRGALKPVATLILISLKYCLPPLVTRSLSSPQCTICHHCTPLSKHPLCAALQFLQKKVQTAHPSV